MNTAGRRNEDKVSEYKGEELDGLKWIKVSEFRV